MSDGQGSIAVVFNLGYAKRSLGVRENIILQSKHRDRFNLEPALILALTKIRHRIELLACQKQVPLSH
jgi:hypothetical protein